jgi:hypothetical protein
MISCSSDNNEKDAKPLFCFVLFISFIHMCIQYLGHFSPLPLPPLFPPAPYLSSTPPHYQAETILPLSLILLKREYKQ